jgi:hypothetical protein
MNKKQAEDVSDRESLAEFVNSMRADLTESPRDWGNHRLESFLDAMARWIEDSRGLEKNTGQNLEEIPRWTLVALLLDAARIYD